MSFVKNDDLVEVKLLRSMYVRGEFYAAGDTVKVGRRDAREMIFQERAAPVGVKETGYAEAGEPEEKALAQEAKPVQAKGKGAPKPAQAKAKQGPQPEGGAAGSAGGSAAPAVETSPTAQATGSGATSDSDF